MWNQDDTSREVFYNTRILRKPISGIISGYHQLSYILISLMMKIRPVLLKLAERSMSLPSFLYLLMHCRKHSKIFLTLKHSIKRFRDEFSHLYTAEEVILKSKVNYSK